MCIPRTRHSGQISESELPMNHKEMHLESVMLCSVQTARKMSRMGIVDHLASYFHATFTGISTQIHQLSID